MSRSLSPVLSQNADGRNDIPEGEDYDTVGGFVFSHLGQIPQAGESFQTGGLEYRILQVAKPVTTAGRNVVDPTETGDKE